MNDPVALPDIDPIDRLAILAAALPGAAVRQRRIAAPFDAVWQVIADVEHATPRYEPDVARVRVIEQRGELLRLLVQDTAGREEAMDARLRPGWCLMQSATVRQLLQGYYELEVGGSGETIWVPMNGVVPEG